jgi:hypothetical protein
MQLNNVSGPSTVALVSNATEESSGASPGPSSLLPDPTSTGLPAGSIAELAVLLTKADEQERESDRELEQASDQAAVRDAQERVQQMMQKASDAESGALASGICSLVGGAVAVGGAFVPGASSSSSQSPALRVAEGVGKTLPEVGALMESVYTASAGRDDANAAQLDSATQADLRQYSEAQSDEQSANDSLEKVRTFLEQVQQSENATHLAAAGSRA